MTWADRNVRRLKLRDLHLLITVVQCGSMAKAAAELAVSQPAVSKAIADMEHALGLRLLDRGRNGVAPTAYGQALVKRGLIIFDELKQGVEELEFLGRPFGWKPADRQHRERRRRHASSHRRTLLPRASRRSP